MDPVSYTHLQGRELGQFVNDFIWYMRNLLIIKTEKDAENMLDMSSDNLALLTEEARLVDPICNIIKGRKYIDVLLRTYQLQL